MRLPGTQAKCLKYYFEVIYSVFEMILQKHHICSAVPATRYKYCSSCHVWRWARVADRTPPLSNGSTSTSTSTSSTSHDATRDHVGTAVNGALRPCRHCCNLVSHTPDAFVLFFVCTTHSSSTPKPRAACSHCWCICTATYMACSQCWWYSYGQQYLFATACWRRPDVCARL